ncbi:hypothetical protein D3C84_1025730 [compost metagenome]
MNIGRHFAEVDLDRLVIAVAFARPVVARMDDRAVAALLIIIEDEIVGAFGLAVLMQQKYGSVQVEIGAAVILVRIPAEADHHFRKTRICLRQVYALPFGK